MFLSFSREEVLQIHPFSWGHVPPSEHIRNLGVTPCLPVQQDSIGAPPTESLEDAVTEATLEPKLRILDQWRELEIVTHQD
jgi:hypothetical protein